MLSVIEATLLGLFAGLTTLIGGVVGTFFKKPSDIVLSVLFGFTAGTMLTAVFANIIPIALAANASAMIAGLVLGVICLTIIDTKLPHLHAGETESKRLIGIGTLICIGDFIHDFPEGLAIGAGFLVAGPLGVLVTFATALHNAPEGFSDALPLFAGGVRRSMAILATFIVSLATAFGAFLGGIVSYISPGLLVGTLGFAGGAVLYITSDELIPEAQRRGHGHAASIGLTLGTILVLIASQIIA
jgi:ZIP family zinc transporter